MAKSGKRGAGRRDKKVGASPGRIASELAVVMAADVVDFSGMMAADEIGTYQRLTALFDEVIRPTVEAFQGRIFKEMGDGFLASFSSTIGASDCAIALQVRGKAHNAPIPEDRKMVLRIGLHVGEAIKAGMDYFGVAVNTAARLEGFAQPGGICISDLMHHLVAGNKRYSFGPKATRQLKNMGPADVYDVVLDEAAIARVPKWRPRKSLRQRTDARKALAERCTALLDEVARVHNHLSGNFSGNRVKLEIEALRDAAFSSSVRPQDLGGFGRFLVQLEETISNPALVVLPEEVPSLGAAMGALDALLKTFDGKIGDDKRAPEPTAAVWPEGAREAIGSAAGQVIAEAARLRASAEDSETTFAERPALAEAANEVGWRGKVILSETQSDAPDWPRMTDSARGIDARLAEPLRSNRFGKALDCVRTLRMAVRDYHSRSLASLPALAVFRDLPDSPDMIIVPAGSFRMGSPDSDKDAFPDEKPQREMTFSRRFALARAPTTFQAYDRFCQTTGRALPEDRGWGRGRLPVISVSWHDAEAYCLWLSRETGAAYRLPSEAEWEYACRAGTAGRYWWGDDWDGGKAHGGGGKKWTAEAAAARGNPWGFWDMLGNVWEWCADHYEEKLAALPPDGAAHVVVTNDENASRVARGGSWNIDPGDLRCAFRVRVEAVLRFNYLGFRLARTL